LHLSRYITESTSPQGTFRSAPWARGYSREQRVQEAEANGLGAARRTCGLDVASYSSSPPSLYLCVQFGNTSDVPWAPSFEGWLVRCWVDIAACALERCWRGGGQWRLDGGAEEGECRRRESRDKSNRTAIAADRTQRDGSEGSNTQPREFACGQFRKRMKERRSAAM